MVYLHIYVIIINIINSPYFMAVHIGSTPIHHPLTSKEFAVISQCIPDWKRLAEHLNVPPRQVKNIEQQNKNTSEQCYQMLTSWEESYHVHQEAGITKAPTATHLRQEPLSSAYLSQSNPSAEQSSSERSSLSDHGSHHFTAGMKPVPYSKQTKSEDVDARTTLICALNKIGIHGQKLVIYLKTG